MTPRDVTALSVRLRVLSLGAGVQSSTLALMAAVGDIGPMPDAAIFADTGWEPAATYKHLTELEKVLPFPVYRVSKGNIRESFYVAKSTGKRYATLPLYVMQPDGSRGMARRQCTKEYKIEPIRSRVSQLCAERGIKKKAGAVEQWIGISLDEVVRMKPSNTRYVVHRWPLIEMGMTRGDCLKWLASKGYPAPPKSACIGCPYHDDGLWRDMKANRPEEFADAVAFDSEIRSGMGRLPGQMRGQGYVHRSCLPLDEVDFSSAEDRGQLVMDGFAAECEGMCGV